MPGIVSILETRRGENSTTKIILILVSILLFIMSLQLISAGFQHLGKNARFSAIGKVYHYNLHSHPIACPFTRLYSLQIFHTLDLSDLYTAAQLFVGTHDFTSFANESDRGSAAINAVRYLQRIDVVEKENGVQLIFEGNGFLYKMVRNIVGTLLEVCGGKKHIDQIPEILAAKDRKKAGKAAPALGLFLAKVIY